MRIIIVGNSPVKSFRKNYVPCQDDYYIGIDGGSEEIIKAGLVLHEAWGDFDSSTNFETIKNNAQKIFAHPSKKNETDLELVLMNIRQDAPIYLYDVLGGRLDHELINILLLNKYNNLPLIIKDETNEICCLSTPGEYTFAQDDFQHIGFITFSKATFAITKAAYLLPKVTITVNDTYTTSNLFDEQRASILLYEGSLIVIKTKI